MAKNNKDKNVLFIGTFTLSIDKKNRLSMPSKWKTAFSHEIIVKKGYEGCLELRTPAEFEIFAERVISAPHEDKNNRIAKRNALGGAHSVGIDASGRFVIPSHLIRDIAANREVCLVGIGNAIELWDVSQYETWRSYNENANISINPSSDNARAV